MDLEEYAEIAGFSPATRSSLRDISHTPANKLSHIPTTVWRDQLGYSAKRWLDNEALDDRARKRLRKIDRS